MSERRSRRTRGERPELVPPKSDEEPNLEDDYVDKDGNKIALGAIRGRRRGRRSRSRGPSSTGAYSKGTSSSSSPSRADRETHQDSPKIAKATTTKKRGRPRGRPPNNRSRSPTPSQSSLSMFGSASESIIDEEGDEDDTMDSESNAFEESNDSDNGENDDAERDTEDDAPKEALTGRKKRGRPKKQKATKYDDEEKHPRYKNSMKVQCRYCGKSLFSQGIKVHERHCMRVNREDSAVADEKPKARKKSSRSRSSSSSSNSSDSRRSSSGSSSSDSSSPPSPVVIVRKKLGRPKKTATNARKATVPPEPVKPFICRNCGRFFTARGINAHEKRCMPVYTERESSSPDTSPLKKKEEVDEEKSQMELDEQKPLDKAPSSPEKDEKISNGPPQKPVFPCRYCGRKFKAQGLKKHERSCLKKKRERIMSENVKAKLGVQKGETKKGKNADKGATKSAANADINDDSSWEDDASSTANDKSANGDNTTSDTGKFITTKKPNNNGSSETLSSVTPRKRKRKWKNRSDANEIEEKGVVSDAMVDAGEDASPNSIADNASRKQAKKPKTRDDAVSVDKTPTDGGRIKSDKVDSLATASAVAVTTKTRKKSLNANAILGAIDSGKVDTHDAIDEKATTKKEKTKAGGKSAIAPSTTSKKNASITAFFPRKTSAKPNTEQLEEKSQEGRGKATGAVESIPLSEKQEGAQTDSDKFIPSSATTTSGENKVRGESIHNQNKEYKGDRTKSNSLGASSETVSAESAPTGHLAKGGADGVSPKKNAVASSVVANELSTMKSEPPNDSSKREERTSEANREPDVVTKIASDAIVDTDSIAFNDEGGSVAGKGNKGRGHITGAVTLNTRPTRKRKLTPKAAQAAAILAKASAIKDEKLMVDDDGNGVTVVESQRVREKKLKTTHGDNVESDGDALDKGITTTSDVERSAKPKRNDSPTEAGESKASGHDDKVENHFALDIMNHAELSREDHGDQSTPKDSAQDSGEQEATERNKDEPSPNDSLLYSDQPKVPDDEHGNKSTPDKNLTKVLVSEHMDESKSNIIPPLSDQPTTLEAQQSDQSEHNVSLPDGDQPKASGAHCGDETKSDVSSPVTDQAEKSEMESRDKTPSSVSPINSDQPKASDSEIRDTFESNASSTDGDQQRVPDAELKDEPEFCGSPLESDMQKQSHTKHNDDSKSKADADQPQTSDAEHEDKSLSHDSKGVGNLRKEVCVDDNDQPQRAAYISQPKALEIENQNTPERKGSTSAIIHKMDVDNVHKTRSQRATGSGIIVEAAKSAAAATLAAFSIFSSKGKSDKAVNQPETEKNAVATISTTQVEKLSNASPLVVVNHSGQECRTVTAGDNESACDDKNSAVCNEAPNATIANTTSSNLIEIGRNAESIVAAPGISKDGTHQTSLLPTSTTENIQTVVSSKFEASSNGTYRPTYKAKVDALKPEVHVTSATAKANSEVAEDRNLQPEHKGTELGNEKIPSIEGMDSNEKKESLLLTEAHSSEKTLTEKKQMSDSLIDTNDVSTLPPRTASRLANQDGSPIAVEDPKCGIDADDTNKVSKKVEMSNPTGLRVESEEIPFEKTENDIVTSGRNNKIGDSEGDERHDSDTKLQMATKSISEKPKTDTTVEREVEEAKTSMDESQTHGFDIKQSANNLTGEGMEEKAAVHTAKKESFPESKIDAAEPSEATFSHETKCSVKNDLGSMSHDAKTEHRGQKLSTVRKVTTDDMNMKESHANDPVNVEMANNKDQTEGNTEKRDAIENEKRSMKQSTVDDESKAERPTYATATELPPKLHLDVRDSQKSVNDSTQRSISHGSLDSSSKENDAAPAETSTVVEDSVPTKPSQNVSAVELDIKTIRKESHSLEVKVSALSNDEVQSTVTKSKTVNDGSTMSSPPKNIESSIDDSNDACISAMKVAKTTSHNEDNLVEGIDEVVNRSADRVEEKGGTKLASDDKTGRSKDSDEVTIRVSGGKSKVDTSSKVREGNDVIGNCNENSNIAEFSNKNEKDTQVEGDVILSATVSQRTVLTGQRRAENVVTEFATKEELEKSEINEAMPQINHQAEASLESASEAKKTLSNEAPPLPGRSSEENELEVGEGGSSKINPKALDFSSIGNTELATAISGGADKVSNGATPLTKVGRSENHAKSLDATVTDEPSSKPQPISSGTDAERPMNGMTMSRDPSQSALEGQNETLLSSVRIDGALELVSNGNDSSVAANGEKKLSVDRTENEQDAAGEEVEMKKAKGVSNVGAISIEISESPTDKSNVTNTGELPVTSTESKLRCSSADSPDTHVDGSREPIAKVQSNDAVPMELDESKDSTGNDKGESLALVAHRLKDDPTKVRMNAKSPGVTLTMNHSTMLDEPESIVRSEARNEIELRTKDAIVPDAKKVQVSWVPLSKVSRHSRPVQRSSSSTEFDQCKVNRVKMLLYATGSQVHRGKGFERIFAMYWDAICLRLSSPLSTNASKRCDDAISEFLKSRRLRKIHNKFIMNVMRHTLKQRISFTDVSQHIPLKWQDRVKIPQVITATKQPKIKRSPRFEPFKENLLQISSVPHFDKQIPYREVWDIPDDETDKKEQNPQEGPTELVASSCIPGALVIDPAIRDIVQDSGMKVTDNAIWLLTVALKEHIKNLLNDSIEYKKGLEKGEIYPQTIHYPNVLATTSIKSKKNSKGKTLTATQDAGQKKHISSIDLFAALNMLPSGQSSSIGGSVSRLSLEHTFLSGFNSMQSFNTGSVFKDVQSFISSEITTMSKERKPEEKKAKGSPMKSGENRAIASRETKAEGGEEEKKKPPPPIAVKASEPISSPISTTDSKALVSNLSPSIVHTPLSTPATDKSLATPKVVKTPQSGSNDSLRADSSAGGSQGIKKDTKDGSEVKVVKITKPMEKATTGVPTQSAAPRSGAGRGAKNLAALMARAAETNTQKDSTESAIGGEKASTNNPAAMIDNKFAAPSNTNVKVSTSDMPKLDTGQIQEKQSQHEANCNRARQTTESLTHSRPNPNIAAESAHSDNNEGANKDAPFPVSKRQPNVPVRRGSGKGFGSKDLAAMRARSMATNKTAETNTAESVKD